MHLISFAISWLLGYLLIEVIFRSRKTLDPYLKFFLSFGVGLGLSGQIVFYNFLVRNHFEKFSILGTHVVLIGLLCGLWVSKRPRICWPTLTEIDWRRLLNFMVIPAALIPIWIWGSFYPQGGWDAWAAWNFKAKFLLTAGDNWKNVFSPILWRSSPHYPLLLPGMNIWGWTLTQRPDSIGPQTTSLLFTFLTAGLLFSGLNQKKSHLTSSLAVLLVVTLPFFIKLTTSQYSDIVVAYYLLSTLICLILAKTHDQAAFSFLAGISLGCLSFSKSEGAMAALLIFLVGILYLYQRKVHWTAQTQLKKFLAGCLIGVLPTVLFTSLVAPANQTFYNGITSTAHPASFFRLKMILAFLLMEFISEKWNGLWLVFLGLTVWNGKNAWGRTVRIVPVVLGLYLSAVGFYYYLNTYFEIAWWLKVSLNRILFAVLPTVSFWVFYSFDEKINARS